MKPRRCYILENKRGQFMIWEKIAGAEHLLVFETRAEATQFLEAELDDMPPEIAEQEWHVTKKWIGDKKDVV